jgi:hypothetical protein
LESFEEVKTSLSQNGTLKRGWKNCNKKKKIKEKRGRKKEKKKERKDVPSINILSYHVCYIFILNQI